MKSMNEIGMISIIMAAYNAEKTIEEAIESVINQTYNGWELIIVDDCSTDRTETIVKQFSDPRIRYIKNAENSGVSITRKVGLDASKGVWIAVLDSDDKWTNTKLEKQVDVVIEKGARLVFTGSAFMNEDGNELPWILHVPKILPYKKLLKQNLISNSSVLVDKELYRRHYAIGDEMHEDFAIWLGITKEGHMAYGIDEPLLIYRLSNKSKSSNKLKAARMNWNTYRHAGLGLCESAYYMSCYIQRSISKYSHLKTPKGGNNK